MANFIGGIVYDFDGVIVAGASVYVYGANGSLAALKNSLGATIANPQITDELGYWSAYLEDTNYTIKYYWGGRLRTIEVAGAGMSAYDIAVKYGYVGTESQWNAAVNAARVAAEAAATAAAGSASAAATSASNAATSASGASASATNAGNSATAAAGSASTASTAATNAGNSATAASGSASTATTQAGIATTQAGNASTSATNASNSATTATTQAGIATTQAGIATTQAGNAAASASLAQAAASYQVSMALTTWTGLSAITGTANQSAAVFGDAGTHTDPVVGGTVNNSGVYSYSISPAGWRRVADLPAAGGAITASGFTQATNKLLGRWSASTGPIQEVTLSTGLNLDGSGNLTAVGGAYTQIGSTQTPSGVASSSITGIPATFQDLLLEITGLSHDSGSNQILRLETSTDGVTWSSPVTAGASIAAAGTWYGSILIPGYRKAAGMVLSSVQNLTSDNTTSPASNGIAWRHSGGLLAVRLSPAAGNLDAGSWKLWGI